jgi:hypothetical protein
MVNELFEEMEIEALDVFRTTQPGDLTAKAAHARILAVQDIRARLTSITHDEKMTRKT